jgi:hypothetical protein
MIEPIISEKEFDHICDFARDYECSPLDYMIECLGWDTGEAEAALEQHGY